jgi:hypothetical protein
MARTMTMTWRRGSAAWTWRASDIWGGWKGMDNGWLAGESTQLYDRHLGTAPVVT